MDDIKKGAFHKWLGKAQGDPITDADIQKGLDSNDEHVRKMAEFAKNSRQWMHESVQQLNEIMGYIKHGDDTIAYNGKYHAGTVKNKDGHYDHAHVKTFDTEDEARKHIDAYHAACKSKVEESFIDLIRTDKVAAEDRFKHLMSEKVARALDARRIELAQRLYKAA